MIDLLVVTGAPGAGKSTTVEHLITREIVHEFTVFDIDWLIEPAGGLLGTRIQESPESWESYAKLWFNVLHANIKNGQTPIFFCPNTKDDFASFGHPDWCDVIHWLLLDCDRSDRQARLELRGWTRQNIGEAMADADEFSGSEMQSISTSEHEPEEVALRVISWARNAIGENL